MSRALYRLVVHLHPRGFRDRFEDEMLAVYDDAVATRGGFRLAASTLFSLVRQWLRPAPVNGMAVPAGTMRAYEICRRRQRLEVAVSSLGLIALAVLVAEYPSAHWPFAIVICVAPPGIYGLARAMWQHVRSPQEYERARLRRPGLREELERKAEKSRMNWGLVWFWTAVLVLNVTLFLLYPEWRQWDDRPARWILAGTLCHWHLWLQRRLAGTLRRELNQVAPLADSIRA